MRHVEAWFFLGSTFASPIVAADLPRPRGVGPEFSKFYKSSDTFTCISNPSVQLELSRVNDDYCDCPDGSDEPGTAACAFLSPLSPPSPYSTMIDGVNSTLALPGFYCKNKGHRSSYVPFTHVNDGVCDHDLCCDGSDEWAGVGGVRCEDKCKEIGKEWRKLDDQRQRAQAAAGKKRKELVVESARLKKEVEDRITTLVTEMEAAEKKVAQLEVELQETEISERGKVVRSSGKTKKVNVLAGLAKERIEELRGALIVTRHQRDASLATIRQLEGILTTFKEEYNPNFNDEGVKRAVRSWEEYAVKRDTATTEEEALTDADLDEISKDDSQVEGGIKWADFEGEEESDVDVLYQFEAYLPQPARDWLDQKLRDLRIFLISQGIIADGAGTGSESPLVATARTALTSAEDDARHLASEVERHRAELTKDFGPDDVFRALKDTCIERDSGEYIYELCFLSGATQKAKKGGASTSLGRFTAFTRAHVDDADVPADGKGLGSGERTALQYENGQTCWNGPARSTLLVLACAEHNEIWKVVEAEKCVYRFEGGSPAVCGPAAESSTPAKGVKDEL
ncbi:MAG: hypothetical protein M1838_005098 [Thelocarpon superellum]|nr:MAG: hypothetical protein M1838_005098 [Thelocarpon superellum]